MATLTLIPPKWSKAANFSCTCVKSELSAMALNSVWPKDLTWSGSLFNEDGLDEVVGRGLNAAAIGLFWGSTKDEGGEDVSHSDETTSPDGGQ